MFIYDYVPTIFEKYQRDDQYFNINQNILIIFLFIRKIVIIYLYVGFVIMEI